MAPRALPTRWSGLERAALALTLALLVFAAAAEFVRLTTPTHPAGGAPLAGGVLERTARDLPPRVVDGRVLQRATNAGFSAVILDENDRALLHVVVPQGPSPVDCNLIDPMVHVAEQDATAVRLVVSGYRYVPVSTARSGHGGTTCISVGSRSIPVRLAAPLGERHLHDGADPMSLVVADPADLPTVGDLPAGYRQRSADPISSDGRGAADLVAERTYAAGSDRLVVRVGSKYDVPTTGTETGNATVEDSYATITRTGRGRCVTWTELSGRVRQLCSLADEPLATPDLLDAARSLSG